MQKISLVKLPVGKKAKIVQINGGHGLHNRLLGLGLYVGRELTKLGNFALKGPVTLRVGRTTVAVGYGVAAKIVVETE